MDSKTDLLKRERDDLRRLTEHWKLQHDEHKKLNAKLAARVEELEAALDKMQRSRDRYRVAWEEEKRRFTEARAALEEKQ